MNDDVRRISEIRLLPPRLEDLVINSWLQPGGRHMHPAPLRTILKDQES